jgi:hypothetical protein
MEEQVRAGTLTIDDYQATLEQQGYAPDDVALLAGLFITELEEAAAD